MSFPLPVFWLTRGLSDKLFFFIKRVATVTGAIAAVSLDFPFSLCGLHPSFCRQQLWQARWSSDVILSKVQASCSETQSPGPLLSAPSLTLNVSGSQVTEGRFLALVSALTSKLTAEHLIAQKRERQVLIICQKNGRVGIYGLHLKALLVYFRKVHGEHIFSPGKKPINILYAVVKHSSCVLYFFFIFRGLSSSLKTYIIS